MSDTLRILAIFLLVLGNAVPGPVLALGDVEVARLHARYGTAARPFAARCLGHSDPS